MSAYVHKSGAQKRKKQKLKDDNDNREIGQLRKIETFLEYRALATKAMLHLKTQLNNLNLKSKNKIWNWTIWTQSQRQQRPW